MVSHRPLHMTSPHSHSGLLVDYRAGNDRQPEMRFRGTILYIGFKSPVGRRLDRQPSYLRRHSALSCASSRHSGGKGCNGSDPGHGSADYSPDVRSSVLVRTENSVRFGNAEATSFMG